MVLESMTSFDVSLEINASMVVYCLRRWDGLVQHALGAGKQSANLGAEDNGVYLDIVRYPVRNIEKWLTFKSRRGISASVMRGYYCCLASLEHLPVKDLSGQLSVLSTKSSARRF